MPSYLTKRFDFPAEFTKTVRDNLHLARVLSPPLVVLFKIEGKCAGFRAKFVHISGHLPVNYCAQRNSLQNQSVCNSSTLLEYGRLLFGTLPVGGLDSAQQL